MSGPSLKELARLSRQLNAASDALSDQIAGIEASLNELKLGVRAYVKIRSNTSIEGGVDVTDSQYLGYAKCRGKWCLTLVDSCDQYPDRDSEIPLREASRDDRMHAIEKLPELVRKLEAETARLVAEARDKAAKVGSFADALKKQG